MGGRNAGLNVSLQYECPWPMGFADDSTGVDDLDTSVTEYLSGTGGTHVMVTLAPGSVAGKFSTTSDHEALSMTHVPALPPPYADEI